MRLMWMSNAPWGGTGYGVQTRHMMHLLRDLGHDVSCFAYWGLDGGIIEWEGFRMYPPIWDQWGNDAVRHHMRDWETDALFTLYDPFVADPGQFAPIGHKWYPWVPVDSLGLASGFDILEHARRIIAMSEFGRRQLAERFGEDKVFMIPHGVDCTVFQNRSEDARRALRTEMGLPPDAFVVGMVQANKGFRKAIDVQLQAFADFYHSGGEDAHLFLHVEPSTVMGGFDIEDIIQRLELKGKGVVHRTSSYHLRRGVDGDVMSKLYGMFDVLLQATAGEGFGVPIIEAQASGVPVIANSGTAMDELVAHRELLCTDSIPFRAPHGGSHFMPSATEVTRKLHEVHDWSWSTVERRRSEARAWAEHFDWARLRDGVWSPFMKLVESDVAPKVWFYGILNGAPISDPKPRVGLWTGSDVESESLSEFITKAPCTVVVCPNDQIDWSCDSYVILEENYWEDDLLALRVSGKPWVVLASKPEHFGAKVFLHEEAQRVIFISETMEWAGRIRGLNFDKIRRYTLTADLDDPLTEAWNIALAALEVPGGRVDSD